MAENGSNNANTKSMIHTAACLIIGDEVLGGKVSPHISSKLAVFPMPPNAHTNRTSALRLNPDMK